MSNIFNGTATDLKESQLEIREVISERTIDTPRSLFNLFDWSKLGCNRTCRRSISSLLTAMESRFQSSIVWLRTAGVRYSLRTVSLRLFMSLVFFLRASYKRIVPRYVQGVLGCTPSSHECTVANAHYKGVTVQRRTINQRRRCSSNQADA